MSNRLDFYFEQLVTQADMDEAFDFAELADQRLQSDNGYVGIAQGIEVVEAFPTPNLTVDINAGVAYDQAGQRCAITAPQNLDISVDSSAVSTAVAGGGNEKWLAVFIAFDRTLSDPRVDGNGVPLQYRRSEGFQFIVDQSAEAPAGSQAVYIAANAETYVLANGMTLDLSIDGTTPQTVTFLTGDFGNIALATAAEVATVIQNNTSGLTAVDNAGFVELTSASNGPGASLLATGGNTLAIFAFPTVIAVGAGGPARPALRVDAILIADILLRQGTTQVFDKPDQGGTAGVVDLDTRRESVFEYDTNFNIRTGTIVEFADSLADILNSHISNTANPHPASAIVWDNESEQWTPGFSNPVVSTDVQAALHEIIDRLKDATSAAGSASGAEIIGMDVATITNTWADGGKPTAGNTNVAGTFSEVVGDLGGAGASDGAQKIGYDDTNFTARYGAVGDLAAALDALASKAARIDVAETISGIWSHSSALTTNDVFASVGPHSIRGASELRGVDLAAAATSFTGFGVVPAKNAEHVFDTQHTLGAGVTTLFIPMEDFGAPAVETLLTGIRGRIMCWDDSGASIPETTMVTFDFLAGILNASSTATITAGLDTNRVLNGGCTNFTSFTIDAPAAGGQAGITVTFAANAGQVRNVAAVWETYKVLKTQ